MVRRLATLACRAAGGSRLPPKTAETETPMLKLNFRAALLGGFVAGAALALPVAAQETEIKYKWEKGQVLHYRMTQESKSKTTGMPGADMEANQTQVVIQKMEVQDVAADKAATVRCT